MRRAYPTDLTDTRWKILRSIVQEESGKGRKRTTDLREVLNAIHYRWTTGCPWRLLPHDFPAWETVYTYFRRWQRDGRLRQIREVLLRKSPYLPAVSESPPLWTHERMKNRTPLTTVRNEVQQQLS